MTRCPTEPDLRAVIDGSTSPEVESHLNACPACRDRLDELFGVTAVSSVLKQVAARPADTPALRIAVAWLESSQAIAFGPNQNDLPTLAPSSRPGFIGALNGIDLRRVLGRGGMGVVYEGHDPQLNRTVAVKVLSPHLAADAEAKGRFLREGRAVAAIAHENVVAVHAIDQSGPLPFLVLQFVKGESLADLLRREGSISADRAAIIGSAIARGLAAAHARGLIHRDIKPANVLIEEGTGVVRLTDFGLAKVPGADSLTGANVVAGTAAYMSPEQATGRPLDGRSDLFSLGTLLYLAVAGRLPFADDSPFVVLNKIAHEAPPPLPEGVPEWFRAIVFRLLEKDPKHRFATAEEVAHALDLSDIPVRRTYPNLGVWMAFAVAALIVAGWFFLPPAINDQRTTLPPVTPAPPPGPPFPLDEQIRAAPNGATIELAGNETHVCSPLDVRGKSLTIRTAPGAKGRARIVRGAMDKPASWLVFDGDITLEGLDISWSWSERPEIIGRGWLTLTNCEMHGGDLIACEGPLTIDHCFLSSNGTCVTWGTTGNLAISHSTIRGRVGVVTPGKLGDRGAAAFTRSAFLTEEVLAVRFESFPVTPVPVTAERCVFDAPNVVVPFFWNGFPRADGPTGAEVRVAARKLVQWADRDNAYRSKVNYLAARDRESDARPGGLTDLKEWLTFWGPPVGTASAGEIRFTKVGVPKLEVAPRTGVGP